MTFGGKHTNAIGRFAKGGRRIVNASLLILSLFSSSLRTLASTSICNR